MLFSSLEFLFLFMPLCAALYFLAPARWRNTVLLLFSLIFYAFGEPIYLFLMLFTIAADYGFGLLLEKNRQNRRTSRIILICAVVINLAILGFFKYYDPIASVLPFLRPIGLALPVGISFYTFQALSYVIDIYRGNAAAAKAPTVTALYVTLFPQLIAGPIVKYNDIEEQIYKRRHSVSIAASGIRRFCVGLAKKVILANTAGELWQSFTHRLSLGTADTVGAWLGVAFYAFQIYFDFSGYSDMALGLGRIFGFELPENFNYPYISQSITEFWRRWHITLSGWFREYVYIPLGGNRRGRGRTYLNLLAVWSLTGIWHGAGANFLLWGLYYFLVLSLEKAFLLRLLERAPRVLRHLYSIFFILIGWLIFAADGSALSLGEGLRCFGIMFGVEKSQLVSTDTLYELTRNLAALGIMCVAATPAVSRLVLRLEASQRSAAAAVCLNILTPLSLVLCVAYLVNSGYNPFLYFRF